MSQANIRKSMFAKLLKAQMSGAYKAIRQPGFIPQNREQRRAEAQANKDKK